MSFIKMNWYKKSQQQEFPFYKEKTNPSPPDAFYAKSPKTDELLNEILYDLKGYHAIVNALSKYEFKWEKIKFPNNIMIKIKLDDGTIKILEDSDFDDPDYGLKDPKDWIYTIYEHELYNYVPPKDFGKTFWDEVGPGYTLYHGTDSANIEAIMKKGLSPRDKTRGINNRFTGSAIFTSDDPNSITSYGDAIFEINVGQMKQDGYMPNVSKEEPMEEANMRQEFADMLGLENMDFVSEYASEGLYDTTIIFYDTIPSKYLRLME